MGKKFFFICALLLVAVTAGGGAIYLISLGRDKKSDQPDQMNTGVSFTRQHQPNKSTVNLYFANREKIFLTSEDRVLLHPDGTAAFGRIIMEALFKGPQEGLVPTVPPGTKLRGLFVTDDGIAYVDISESVTAHHPGGAKTELLTIYSIVNSLVLNIPEIDAVKILIGGREAATLAGHIDLRFPLKANMLLVR